MGSMVNARADLEIGKLRNNAIFADESLMISSSFESNHERETSNNDPPINSPSLFIKTNTPLEIFA